MKILALKCIFFIVFYPQVELTNIQILTTGWKTFPPSASRPWQWPRDRWWCWAALWWPSSSLLCSFSSAPTGDTDGQLLDNSHSCTCWSSTLNFSLNHICQAGITLFLLSLYLIIMYFAHLVMWSHWRTVKRNSKDLCHIDFLFKHKHNNSISFQCNTLHTRVFLVELI